MSRISFNFIFTEYIFIDRVSIGTLAKYHLSFPKRKKNKPKTREKWIQNQNKKNGMWYVVVIIHLMIFVFFCFVSLLDVFFFWRWFTVNFFYLNTATVAFLRMNDNFKIRSFRLPSTCVLFCAHNAVCAISKFFSNKIHNQHRSWFFRRKKAFFSVTSLHTHTHRLGIIWIVNFSAVQLHIAQCFALCSVSAFSCDYSDLSYLKTIKIAINKQFETVCFFSFRFVSFLFWLLQLSLYLVIVAVFSVHSAVQLKHEPNISFDLGKMLPLHTLYTQQRRLWRWWWQKTKRPRWKKNEKKH